MAQKLKTRPVNEAVDTTPKPPRDIVHSSPVPAFLATREGVILDINVPGLKLLGYRRSEIRGRSVLDFCANRQQWTPIESRLTKGRSIRGKELHLCKKDGSTAECLLASKVIAWDADVVHACFLWDLTHYMGTIRDLRSTGEQYQLLAAMEKDGLWIGTFKDDGSLAITLKSDSLGKIIGFSPEEMATMTLEQWLTPSSYTIGMQAVEDQLHVEGRKDVDPARAWVSEYELRHKNGHTVWAEVKTTFMRGADGRPVGILGTTRDITERRRYEEQLKALSSRLVQLQEAERRHIARELHDEIGQSLTALGVMLDTIPKLPPREAGRSIREAQSLISDLMDLVKDLSLELRPSTLDDLGLLPTLVLHFNRYEALTGTKVVFKQNGMGERFHPDLETAVFRIIQEGLTNVTRHAHVNVVDVQIIAGKKKIRIEIVDHGRGFDPEEMYASGGASGIVGMRERASLLGGRLSIYSRPGEGTHLIAELPIKRQRE